MRATIQTAMASGPPLMAAPDVPDEHGGDEEGDRHHDVHERQPDVHVGVAGAVDRAGGGVQEVPAAEQLADADHDEDRREDAREMGDGAAAELEVDLRQLRRGGPLGAGEGRGRSGLVVRRAAGALRSAPTGGLGEVDAAHHDVHDRRQDERRDQRAEDEVLQRLPHRQREDVEPDVVAEDRVLLAERGLLHVEEERLPLRRGRDAGDEGDHEAHAQAAPPDPAAHPVAARLEQVAGGGDAVARRQAARELHVELDDDEEEREADDADQHLPPDARPEDAAEARPRRTTASRRRGRGCGSRRRARG